jgi:glycerol kinase
MSNAVILSLDQGTTSSRAILFDHSGKIKASAQKDFEQIYPRAGWVEHDPLAIWSTQLETAKKVLAAASEQGYEVAGIGITNQRETTLVWDRTTGEPVCNAIVWQDRRTAEACDSLKNQGLSEIFKSKTGLIVDAYFSGTKLKWILDNIEGARERALNGELCFGTVDTWIIWKLTKGKVFITDVSNASRTMLCNIHTLDWDDELLELLDIPRIMLPDIRESSQIYGYTEVDILGFQIPISGIAGDQQAALFGQLCIKPGMVKNTYGTGCFLLMNTGIKPIYSNNNLLTTVAWKIKGEVNYALEGSVFVGGAAVQWIRDGLNLIDDAKEIEELAETVPDNDGVYFVPALTGLGAPYWDPYARGGIFGLTRGTKKGHIARATIEGIAYQVYDVVKAMEADSGTGGTELRVDGGASANNLLLQFQTDIFRFPVVRPNVLETTALGAAYLAGLAVGYWKNLDELREQWGVDRRFNPKENKEVIDKKLILWQKAVSKSRSWVEI